MNDRVIKLQANEINLWMVDDKRLKNSSLLETYAQWLSESETAQWKRFHFARDRHQYLITRALVRSALTNIMPSIQEAQWRFSKNKYGRPSVANLPTQYPHLTFNLSHTNEAIVLALTLDGELGVDVENINRRGELVEIAHHYFAKNETECLLKLPQAEQRERFFDLWTLKESYIKARGMGLSIALDSFSFSFPDDKSIEFEVDKDSEDRAKGWYFWQFCTAETHKTALAYRNTSHREPVRFNYITGMPDHYQCIKSCQIHRATSNSGRSDSLSELSEIK